VLLCAPAAYSGFAASRLVKMLRDVAGAVPASLISCPSEGTVAVTFSDGVLLSATDGVLSLPVRQTMSLTHDDLYGLSLFCHIVNQFMLSAGGLQLLPGPDEAGVHEFEAADCFARRACADAVLTSEAPPDEDKLLSGKLAVLCDYARAHWTVPMIRRHTLLWELRPRRFTRDAGASAALHGTVGQDIEAEDAIANLCNVITASADPLPRLILFLEVLKAFA